jgi:hypothetical protein
MTVDDARLRQKALELVQEAYENVVTMSATDTVDLARLNQGRPPSHRYASREALLDEWEAMAGAVSTFAVSLGVLSPDEAAQVIRDFSEAHPELDDGEWETWEAATNDAGPHEG